MAYDTLRASGNNQYGQMSDVDRANFGSQQQAQDFILRKRLQDEALAKNDSGEAARLAAQQAMQEKALAAQKEMGGTFGERSALEDKRLDRSLSPQMEMLRQQQERFNLGREDNKPARDAANAQLQLRNSIMSRLAPSMGGGAGPIDSKTLRMLAPFAGVSGIPSDPEDDMIRSVITHLAGQAAESGDIGSLKELMGAAASGDISQIPTNIGPAPQALSLEDVKKSAIDRTSSFATRDASWKPFDDPNESDVADLVKQRDDLANALKARTPRLSDQQARDGANRLIDDELQKPGAHWNTGWIDTARKALGIR